MWLAQIFVYAFLAYLAAGAVFALWFVTRGVGQMDEGMRHVKWGVRALIFPGSMAFFPLLWRKWRQARRGANG